MDAAQAASLALRPLVSKVPKIATPMVEPIWRKNWLALVTTPMRFIGTAFCMARLNRLCSGPKPDAQHRHPPGQVEPPVCAVIRLSRRCRDDSTLMPAQHERLVAAGPGHQRAR